MPWLAGCDRGAAWVVHPATSKGDWLVMRSRSSLEMGAPPVWACCWVAQPAAAAARREVMARRLIMEEVLRWGRTTGASFIKSLGVLEILQAQAVLLQQSVETLHGQARVLLGRLHVEVGHAHDLGEVEPLEVGHHAILGLVVGDVRHERGGARGGLLALGAALDRK